jgi:hypothetical protein
VLGGMLHVLRDRLTIQEAVQPGAQLPMLIRGLYWEGWDPARRRSSSGARSSSPVPRGEARLSDLMRSWIAARTFHRTLRSPGLLAPSS